VRESGVGYWLTTQLKLRLAEELLVFMGEEALTDSMASPRGMANMVADRERAACQADRRRS